jgi:crossover junction endodeoxyribonuclease RuvC
MIIGIDPGKSGALAVLGWLDTPYISPFKDKAPGKIMEVLKHLSAFQGVETTVYLEQVRSSPQQGVVSAFTFGRGYGFLEGVVMGLGLPIVQVRPSEWQGALGCMSGGDKGKLAAYARKLYPSVKITNDTADAVLIAHYGMMSEKYRRDKNVVL